MHLTLKVTDTATKHLDRSSFKVWRGLDAGIKEGLEKTKKKMKANVSSRLQKRTGTAERSIEVRGPWGFRDKKILGRVGTFPAGKSRPGYKAADYYLRAHEYGTILRPRKAAYLVIPQPDGTIRKVRSATLPSRSWFRPAIKPPTILGAILKHIERALRG